jgi:hypothetical protein
MTRIDDLRAVHDAAEARDTAWVAYLWEEHAAIPDLLAVVRAAQAVVNEDEYGEILSLLFAAVADFELAVLNREPA